MPTLTIKTLFCEVTEDSGTDEAYLIVDGRHIWGPTSMSAGQGKTVNYQKNFVNSVEIKLFDQDGPFDNDDSLGTITVASDLKGKGEQTRQFTGDGAKYTLYFFVA
jgi:hypothetical protein